MQRTAVISDDGLYRYELRRDWREPGMVGVPAVTWVMLNPSTADAEVDDPTIRRCVSFTRDLGYHRLIVVNLFAYRAAKPADALAAASAGTPITGARNTYYMERAIGAAGIVVCAWGTGGDLLKHIVPRSNPRSSCRALGMTAMCLGRTKNGQPRHPLYVPASKQLEPWS